MSLLSKMIIRVNEVLVKFSSVNFTKNFIIDEPFSANVCQGLIFFLGS